MPADPKRVQDIFLAAVAQPDRAAVLDRECGADAELRQRVEALLRANDAPGSFLEGPGTEDVPPPPAPADAIGTVIAGRYKLLQQIGEGGMGAVFMAEQTNPVKRLVALKVVKAGLDSRTVLARFEAERQALALMNHPNIAQVLDAGTTEHGQPFFVMELVKGVPLTQFCDDRQLSVADRLLIFQQVCQAVQHAHQKGIIHRDLKPGNILVESHDGKPVPKVIDFGLAKAMHALPLTERSLFTQFGAVLGTPLYMAPEQAELSAIDVDTRADIYALGVILYELLTGTTPLEKKRLQEAAWDEIRRVIKEEEPPKPSTRLSSSEGRASIAARRQSEPGKLGRFVRGDLDWITMKALAKERDRRYQTANALTADVGRFLNHEPVSAGPPTVRYKVRKFVRRNRGAVLAAGLVLLALVLGIAGTTWGLVWALAAEGVAREEEAKALAERDEKEKARAAEAVQRKEAVEQRDRAVRAERETKKQAAMSAERVSNLGSLLQERGDLNGAEQLFRDALAMRRRLYPGRDHPALADSFSNLGSLLQERGDLAGAERHFRDALAMRRRLYSKAHPKFADSLSDLGLLLLARKNYADSELPLRQALTIREKLQPDNWRTWQNRSVLGAALLGQKKYAEAEPLLTEGYEGMKKREATIPPQGRPRLAEAAERLVQLYEATGRDEQAAAWRKKRDEAKKVSAKK